MIRILGTLGTLVALCIATLQFLRAENIIFPPPLIEGYWYCQTLTRETTVDSYKDLILRYRIVLVLEDNQISGTSEKYYEYAPNIKGKGRGILQSSAITHGDINGYIKRAFFRKKEKLSFLIIEEEVKSKRRSTNFFEMRFDRYDKIMVGRFKWTAASKEGAALCQEEVFLPEELNDEDVKEIKSKFTTLSNGRS